MADLVSRRMAEAKMAEPNLGRFGTVGIDLVNHVIKKPYLIIKKVLGTRREVSGLLIQTWDDNLIIDVKEGDDYCGFANQLAQTEIEIEDGTLLVLVDGVRKRCRSVGVFEDLEAAPGRLVLPKKFSIPKVETLASKDDSFGKAKWRGELKEMAGQVFPEGIEKVPAEFRRVLMFPGLGQEADLWKEFGFAEEEMHFIEEDLYVAKDLREKYPGARIFERNVETSLRAFKMFLAADKFSVISIDPESKLSEKFFQVLVALSRHTAAETLFAHNFFVRRESKAIVRYYRQVAKIDDPKVPIEELRMAANGGLLQRSLDQIRHPYNFKEPKIISSRTGQYESGKGSAMMYAMHHLRKQDEPK